MFFVRAVRLLATPSDVAPRCAPLLSLRRLVLLTVLVGAPQPLRRCALLPRFAALDLYLSIRRARLRRLRPQGRGRPFPCPLQISRGPSRRDSQVGGLVPTNRFLRLRSCWSELSRRPLCPLITVARRSILVNTRAYTPLWTPRAPSRFCAHALLEPLTAYHSNLFG